MTCKVCKAPLVWKKTSKGIENKCIYDCKPVVRKPVKIIRIKIEDLPKYIEHAGVTQFGFEKICKFKKMTIHRIVNGIIYLTPEKAEIIMETLNRLRSERGLRGKL